MTIDDPMLDQLAALAGVELRADSREAVRQHLQNAAAMVASFNDLQLNTHELDLAPVFQVPADRRIDKNSVDHEP